LQGFLLEDSLRLELLFAELTLQVCDLLPRVINLLILGLNLSSQIHDLLVQTLLVGLLLVLEVLDDVELVFLQHVIVRVEFIILLLQALRLGFSFLSHLVVDLELLGHMLELLVFGSSQIPQVLQLTSFGVDCLLQIVEMQRLLSTLLVKIHLGLAERPSVFIQVPLVQSFNVLHSLVPHVQLLTQLIYFDLLRLQELVALLSLLLELKDAASETIEILQHDQPLDVGERLLRVLVQRLLFLLVAESRADNVLDALR